MIEPTGNARGVERVAPIAQGIVRPADSEGRQPERRVTPPPSSADSEAARREPERDSVDLSRRARELLEALRVRREAREERELSAPRDDGRDPSATSLNDPRADRRGLPD